MNTPKQAERVQIKRLINASRECAFAAWTKPGQVKQWFGPSTCRVLDAQVDARPGGKYRIRVFNEKMGKMAVRGEYREVDAPSRLAFTWQWEDDDDWKGVESVVTIEFKKRDDGTDLLLTHEGFPSSESAKNHESGWNGALEKLEIRSSFAREVFGPGRFSWNELLAHDVEKACAFYTKLFGWEAAPFPGEMPYTLFKKNGTEVGGLMKNPAPDAPPNWLPYITVENTDATAARIGELGGKVMVQPFDVPGVGRLACAFDPQGAAFGIFQPAAK